MYFSFSVFSLFSPYSRSYSVHFSFFTFFCDFVIFQVVKWIFLIFHDFQFSCHIPCPTVDISKFSNFFSFRRHISPLKVCMSHFPWFSVFWPYSMTYSVHFSSFIFFNISHHISLPNECYSHSLWFSVFSPYSRSYSVHFSFFTLISDFVIFQTVKWMFLIFHDFQFSCHIPCPTADIAKFSTFFCFPRHI